MKYAPSSLFMVSEEADHDFRPMMAMDHNRRLPEFVVSYANSDFVSTAAFFDSFEAIDAYPRVTMTPLESIKDFNLFAPAFTKANRIIVEPQTVSALLDQIKKLQAPQLAEIRKRNHANDRQLLHAQIVSIAA